jgi:hypothetical protein
MEEIWRPIDNYPNYNVSNLGNIKNINTNKVLKINCKDGYYGISLVNDETKKTFKVHRLVALAFIENPENKSDVNHKDKNKLNNIIDNLEWTTQKENIIHGSGKKVAKIDIKTNNIIKIYSTITEAYKELNIPWNSLISKVCNKEKGRKTIYGFKWEYVN